MIWQSTNSLFYRITEEKNFTDNLTVLSRLHLSRSLYQSSKHACPFFYVLNAHCRVDVFTGPNLPQFAQKAAHTLLALGRNRQKAVAEKWRNWRERAGQVPASAFVAHGALAHNKDCVMQNRCPQQFRVLYCILRGEWSVTVCDRYVQTDMDIDHYASGESHDLLHGGCPLHDTK